MTQWSVDPIEALNCSNMFFEYKIWQQTEIDDIQFGFMKGKGTTDDIFIVRQMEENFRVKERSSILALWIWGSFQVNSPQAKHRPSPNLMKLGKNDANDGNSLNPKFCQNWIRGY